MDDSVCYWCRSPMEKVVLVGRVFFPICSYHEGHFVASYHWFEYFNQAEGRRLLFVQGVLHE